LGNRKIYIIVLHPIFYYLIDEMKEAIEYLKKEGAPIG